MVQPQVPLSYRSPQRISGRSPLGLWALGVCAGADLLFFWCLYNLSWMVESDLSYFVYGLGMWLSRILAILGLVLAIRSCATGSRRLGTVALVCVGLYAMSLFVLAMAFHNHG